MEFDVAGAEAGVDDSADALQTPASVAARRAFDVHVRDPWRTAVEAESGGRITIIYDRHGHPNHMYVLPRMTYAGLGLARVLGPGNVSAFEVAGVVKPEIFIGVYQASHVDGVGCSLPSRRPWVDVSYDEAVAAASAKGRGWHLMSAHEWAAIAFWCMANGYQPRGNVAQGSAGGRHRRETARDCDNAHRIGRTGSGPMSWRHTGDASGIADLVGNALEWNSLIKLVDGQVHATWDNDYMANEADWAAQGRYLNCAGGRITLTNSPVSVANTAYRVAFRRFRRAGDYRSSTLLRRLLVEPLWRAPRGHCYVRDHGERMLSRGGEPETGGGLAAAFIYDGRDAREPDVGFRVAYIP